LCYDFPFLPEKLGVFLMIDVVPGFPLIWDERKRDSGYVDNIMCEILEVFSNKKCSIIETQGNIEVNNCSIYKGIFAKIGNVTVDTLNANIDVIEAETATIKSVLNIKKISARQLTLCDSGIIDEMVIRESCTVQDTKITTLSGAPQFIEIKKSQVEKIVIGTLGSPYFYTKKQLAIQNLGTMIYSNREISLKMSDHIVVRLIDTKVNEIVFNVPNLTWRIELIGNSRITKKPEKFNEMLF